MSAWEETMWADLEAMPETEQIVVTGEWITRMTQSVLPQLGRIRRLQVLKVLNGEGMDATRLAEIIGSRRTTITRLAEEGRAIRREDNINEAAAARV